jgi:hypothetical protein
MLSDRKSKVLLILLSCVIAMVCFGTLYFMGDLARFQERIVVKESQTALRDVNDLDQLDRLLKQYPSNRVLKLVALANRDLIEIDAATRGLLNEAEPADLSRRMDKGFSSRADLEALGRDLKMAEGNAAALESRYVALLKVARDKVEHDASALEGRNNTRARFMAMIDEQHAGMKDLISRISAARLAYYGAYEKCVALLAHEFGVTKVVNGQFIFPLQSQADSYNEAAAAMAAAAKRLAELETERTVLAQPRLDKWKSLVDG